MGLTIAPYLKGGIGTVKQNEGIEFVSYNAVIQGLNAGVQVNQLGGVENWMGSLDMGYWGSNRWELSGLSLEHKERTGFWLPITITSWFIFQPKSINAFFIGIGLTSQFQYHYKAAALDPLNNYVAKHRFWCMGLHYYFEKEIPTWKIGIHLKQNILPISVGSYESYLTNEYTILEKRSSWDIISRMQLGIWWKPHPKIRIQLEYQWTIEGNRFINEEKTKQSWEGQTKHIWCLGVYYDFSG